MLPLSAPVSPYQSTTVDPYYSYVCLLCNFQGSNGGTSFPDDSQNHFTASTTGTPTTSTAQYIYGASSLLLNGSTDGIYFADNSAFYFGSSDYTIEFWLYPNSVTGIHNYPSQYNDASRSFNLYTSDTEVAHTLFGVAGGSVTTAGAGLSIGTWKFIACVRDGGTLRAYVDGIQYGSGSVSGTATDSTAPLRIGFNGVGSNWGNGYIGPLRITNGICRYPNGTTFLPPAGLFPTY